LKNSKTEFRKNSGEEKARGGIGKEN
jgi:hypothetical protein